MRGKNLGKQIEEIVAMKNKAERNAKVSKEDYVNLSIKYAEQISRKLNTLLEQTKDKEADEVTLADNIYSVLLETDLRKLEKSKDNYDMWQDLDDKFNS